MRYEAKMMPVSLHFIYLATSFNVVLWLDMYFFFIILPQQLHNVTTVYYLQDV